MDILQFLCVKIIGIIINIRLKKSRIRETPTLSTDADSRTDTNLKRLRDLSLKQKKKYIYILRGCVIYLQKK